MSRAPIQNPARRAGLNKYGLISKTSVYDLQIETLPETARYADFKKLFGSDEIIRVVIKSDNVFDLAVDDTIHYE